MESIQTGTALIGWAALTSRVRAGQAEVVVLTVVALEGTDAGHSIEAERG